MVVLFCRAAYRLEVEVVLNYIIAKTLQILSKISAVQY